MIYLIDNNIELFNNTLITKSTIELCKDWLEIKESIILDVETEGLFNHSNKMVMLILSDGIDTYVIDTRVIDISILKNKLESILIIGQNLKFDYKFLKFYNIEFSNIYDTMLAEVLLTNGTGTSCSLESICNRYLNVILNKSITMQFTRLGGKPFTLDQIIYGVQDTIHLYKIKELQKKELDNWQLNSICGLENKACLALADIEYNGFLFDKEAWIKLSKEVEINLISHKKQLDNLVLENKLLTKKFVKNGEQLGMFGVIERQVKINWDSPLQIKKVFNTIGLDIESTNEKVISTYQDKYPLVKKFIDYKKEAKLLSTYGISFLEYINPTTKRIHTDFWQIKETNRVSSNKPNLQNIPANNKYLNCFIAPEGRKIIGIDYSGQEAKIAACGSKESVWLNTFKEGKDLHSEVCKMMFNIDDSLVRSKPDFLRGKTYRDAAKTINFGVLFGMSKFKLSSSLNITVEEADALIKKYFKATINLKRYLDSCANYGLKNGYIRSFKPFSSIRFFPEWKENLDSYKDFKIIGEITRASYNTPIQCTGAVMTKLALIKVRNFININNLKNKVKLIHVVHDAVYTECIDEYAEEFSLIQAKLMAEAGEEFNLELPMTTDISITNCWNK